MSNDRSDIAVHHRPEQHRFEAIVEGQRAVADYRLNGQVVQMTHTEVPAALEGRGIAAALVVAALNWIEQEGLKLDPLCSYVRGYLARHPQWQHLVA
jgi:predicted GNAT family acetyltransferase